MTIESIWSRICAHAGEIFRQIRGGEFTYDVDGNFVNLHRTNQRIPKSDFEKVRSHGSFGDVLMNGRCMPRRAATAIGFVSVSRCSRRVCSGIH